MDIYIIEFMNPEFIQNLPPCKDCTNTASRKCVDIADVDFENPFPLCEPCSQKPEYNILYDCTAEAV